MIAAKMPRGGLEIYRSIEDLTNRFRYRSHDIAAAVLVASSTSDLKSLTLMRDLFEDTRIILILPDGDRQTISLGHSLYPRFIGYSDGNMGDIAAVINKILGPSQNYIMDGI